MQNIKTQGIIILDFLLYSLLLTYRLQYMTSEGGSFRFSLYIYAYLFENLNLKDTNNQTLLFNFTGTRRLHYCFKFGLQSAQ